MLKLFSNTATNFDTLGLGVLKDYVTDPIITEELNGPYTLEFEYAKNGYLSEQLVETNIIVAKGQAFRIWNIDKSSIDRIKILAKHIFFDLSFNFLEDVEPTNLTSNQALSWILARTKSSHLFTVNGDCSLLSTARYVRKNVVDAIYNEDNALLKRFGGELEFNNYNIYVHAKRGQNSNFQIRYKKNFTGIDFKLDFSTVVTRIMPQGANELLIDEKYVDSPRINSYFTPIYRKIDFGDIGVDENTTEAQAKLKLKTAAQKLFTDGIDLPQISIKVDFIELSKCDEYKEYSSLESCNLGDTIKAIIPELNLNLETRIIKTVYNVALKRYITLELGSSTPNIATNQINLKNTINQINPISILSKASNNAASMINHPFNGNILIDDETGILYLMDTTNPSTAQHIWKWSLGGLGYSSTGIDGPYGIAITQDGSINADYITTGKLNTSVIEGYDNLISIVSGSTTFIKTSDTNYLADKEYYIYDSNLEDYVIYEDYDVGDVITGNIYELITVDDLNTRLDDLKDAIGTINSTILNQTAEQFEMLFVKTGIKNDLDNLSDLLHSSNDTLDQIVEYIRFKGASIELGKETSPVKLLITNDKISFMTGENESAFISNNQLYITDSTILNKLQVGHWETKEDTYFNLNTRWVNN